MRPAIPVTNSPIRPLRQQLRTISSSSEYIGIGEIASPTSPLSNIQSRESELVNVTLMKPPTTADINVNPIMEYNTINSAVIEAAAVVNNNEWPSSLSDHSVAAGNTRSNRTTVPCQNQTASPLHAITTPNGLVAIFPVPNNDPTEPCTDNLILSQKYPGYVEHTLNDAH